MTLLEIAETLRMAQSALNLSSLTPGLERARLDHAWVSQCERGAWGHVHDAMVQVLTAMDTGHTANDILDGVYDNGESIAYNIDWLNRSERFGVYYGDDYRGFGKVGEAKAFATDMAGYGYEVYSDVYV
jgi:hypothetical protein